MPVLRISATACFLIGLALHGTRCDNSEPCVYEDVHLSGDDLTPWGSRVEDDLAALAGPYEGIWRWSVTVEHLEIPASGQALPVRVTLDLDPSSYRRSELSSGGRGGVCVGDSILADGALKVVDLEGATILDIPITVTRWAGASPEYNSTPYFSPVTDFLGGLVSTPEHEYDEEGVSGLLVWGPDGEWLHVEFTYFAKIQHSPTSGGGLSVDVAEFTGEP